MGVENPKDVNLRNTSSNLFQKVSKQPLYTALRSVRNSIITNESCYNQQLLTIQNAQNTIATNTAVTTLGEDEPIQS
jgi:hypothetical protein